MAKRNNIQTLTLEEPYKTNAKLVAAILKKGGVLNDGNVSALFRYLLDKEIDSNQQLKRLTFKHQ